MILFNLSGHGLLDMASYDAYNQGRLKEDSYDITKDDIRQRLPEVNLA